MLGKYSPTVAIKYIKDQNWFDHSLDYDPEGYDSYGYNSEGVDRAGIKEDDYCTGDLYERVFLEWLSKK